MSDMIVPSSGMKTVATSPPTAPTIRRLTIERFRGIKKLVWHPSTSVNVIIGGGDVGKTTVLDAVALLFSPTNAAVLSEADYWQRDVSSEFLIEAVMSLPGDCGISECRKHIWPWEWDGVNPIMPTLEEEPPSERMREAVYCLRVRGTSDFEPAFEVLQPDGEADHLPASVRRRIGLVKLSGDDRNDRDLRLVQGSALDRLISDKTLRARLGKALGACDVEGQLSDDAKKKLVTLDKQFRERPLPANLSLGLTGSQGVSFNALVGLLSSVNGVKLPLSSWGAGTRRLAALEISGTDQGGNPITLVDEVERGLEPYRQRVLVAELQESASQVFLTTHSATSLGALASASIWHMDGESHLGQLKSDVAPFLRRDPEAFLSRLTIVAEGATEVGFVEAILEYVIGGEIIQHGIWITDAEGNESALALLEGLVASGLKFGGFVDNEETYPTKWQILQEKLGALLFRWPKGCLEENIINLVPSERFPEFIADPDGHLGDRLRTLAHRLRLDDKDYDSIKAATPDLRKVIAEAASGSIPESWKAASKDDHKILKKHSARWFKSKAGGRELAQKALKLGALDALRPQLAPFLSAVLYAASPQNPRKPR